MFIIARALYTLNADIIASLQISQHHYKHHNITPDVAISTQTLQPITNFVPHRRHRNTFIDSAPLK